MKENSKTHIEIDWHVILGDRDRRVAMSGSLMTSTTKRSIETDWKLKDQLVGIEKFILMVLRRLFLLLRGIDGNSKDCSRLVIVSYIYGIKRCMEELQCTKRSF
ncbi:hypothetical protein QL285_046821 [Trifolium repens]|nr:hypothetical protein QL285_046821 [Trifolium repens]